MTMKTLLLTTSVLSAVILTGCEGVREHIRDKDFRKPGQPAYRPTGAASPIANVADMPGWTTEYDSAIAFATENPQNTVVFFQQSGNPETEATKKILNSSQAESALSGKQRVTINMATSPEVAGRLGVRTAPAVVLVGPGGVPTAQKTGRVSSAELIKFIK